MIYPQSLILLYFCKQLKDTKASAKMHGPKYEAGQGD
jgi:hypothetical protein